MNENASKFWWFILRCFWGPMIIGLSLIALLRINSLIHVYSPTPHKDKPAFSSELRPLVKGTLTYDK
jgi:hypothetical protein